jgi:transcription initiation factor TFIIIB Brf1 subunit/transcription initiation factor TFIIB
MTDDAEQRCNRCGGEAVPTDGNGVAVLECADCGNVLGLAQAEPDADTDSADDTESVDTGTVHVTDGNLDQLRRLLRRRDGEDSHIEADRLLLDTETATIGVTANGDALDIRAVDDE